GYIITLVTSSSTPTPSARPTTSTATHPTPPVVAPHVVEYRVSGTALYASITPAASVTYRNVSGGTEQQQYVRLPWTYRVGEARRGQSFYISAQGFDEGTGSVVVEIVIDGAVVKRSESSGEYSIATASGRF
ncbi:MAG TPA: MmpS family transport accessory protein, partial [Gaiellaceae bacterium]|nr:MmpS family transport accessory protein [Gaiellaceae bacterium]